MGIPKKVNIREDKDVQMNPKNTLHLSLPLPPGSSPKMAVQKQIESKMETKNPPTSNPKKQPLSLPPYPLSLKSDKEV